MFSIASPLWLLALAALPIIWWLHRLSSRPQSFLVSAIGLWQTEASAISNRPAQPFSDPRWWLRAAAWLLFVLALTGIGANYLVKTPVTVWIDDSISMHTQEQGRSRLQLAAAQVQERLTQGGFADVILRPLSDHQIQHRTKPGAALDWIANLALPDVWPRLWIPSHLDLAREHWLVTDGADPALLAVANFDVRILIGSERINAALTSVSVRPSLTRPDQQLIVAFDAVAYSAEPLRRQLLVRADEYPAQELLLQLTADSYAGQLMIPRDTKHLELELLPKDNLTLDDAISIDLSALRPVLTQVGGSCSAPLLAALDANPMLQQIPSGLGTPRPTLAVDCGDSERLMQLADEKVLAKENTNAITRLLIHNNASIPVEQPVRWFDKAKHLNQLFLAVDTMQSVPLQLGGDALLRDAQQQPLVVRQHNNTHVLLDVDNKLLTQDPVYPYLVANIVQLATGKNLIDPIARQDRDPEQSRIARGKISALATEPSIARAQSAIDLTDWLLPLLIVLLLIDLVARRSVKMDDWRRQSELTTAPKAVA